MVLPDTYPRSKIRKSPLSSVNSDDVDVKSILTHFHVNNELRGIDRDNALSRL